MAKSVPITNPMGQDHCLWVPEDQPDVPPSAPETETDMERYTPTLRKRQDKPQPSASTQTVQGKEKQQESSSKQGMESLRPARRTESPIPQQQEDATPQRQRTQDELIMLQTLGFMSISDTAFALQSFSGSANCGDKAEKWLEQFKLYTSFKKITPDDKLKLFKLLMKDQAAG
jgi:hypothetical protein